MALLFQDMLMTLSSRGKLCYLKLVLFQ